MERAQTIATAMVSANASLRSRLSDADIPSYAGWALLKAALRWDPEKSPFESWLRVMIRFELEEAARFQAPVRRHGMQYLQLLAEAERYLGADASVEALAQHLEWPTERVRQVLSWRESSHEPLSLDNSLELSASSEVEDEALDRVVVSDAIRQLSDSERAVIFLHYFEDVPFNVIATELGLSKSKVSRIYSRAKRQLRTHLQAA